MRELTLKAHPPVVLCFQRCFGRLRPLEILACGLQYSKGRIRAPRFTEGNGFFANGEGGEMQTKGVSRSKNDQHSDFAVSPAFRAAIFITGDWMFLIFTGIAASLAMHLVHSLDWHLAFVLPVGTVAAMLVQMLLAKAVAPVLGSIESLIPSMLVAMFVPMLICLSVLVGIGMSGWAAPLSLGALGGTGVFLLIRLYDYRCKRFFALHISK